MSQAVVTIAGKQYIVAPGQQLKVDRFNANKEGDVLTFEEVLVVSTGKTTKVGQPVVAGAKVEAKVVNHARYDKVVGAKVKSKKRYKKYFGHKQQYTTLEITKITSK
jgi:large subunit ribosomal protein L21